MSNEREQHLPSINVDPHIVEVAAMALDESRTSLMMSFRYLDRALFKMPLVPADLDATLTTDGKQVFFDPRAVLLRYRHDPNELARDLLHTILHCVFRHPFKTERENIGVWSEACDIVVETIAMEMCKKRFRSPDDARRHKVAEQLTKEVGTLVPAKLYRARMSGSENGVRTFVEPDMIGIRKASPIADAVAANPPRDMSLFERDSHSAWDLRPTTKVKSEDDQDSEGTPDHSDEPIDDVQPGFDENSENPSNPEGNEDYAAEWEEIAKQIEADLKSFSLSQGTDAGSLVNMLSLANRRQVDYTEFLRNFATMTEDLCANPEEFDYIFYTYGLEHYGNMPLVEPLEYYEHHRLREFVIALDTSGSCSGELVRMFVTRTYDILNESALFGHSVHVRILQCDARVQNDTIITNREDFARFSANLEVMGGGGTDFRPVFDYVGNLIAHGEFTDLRGLIYFTDGMGTFPEIPPPYETAFVFVEEEGLPRSVPPWAMKVVIDQDQIVTR